MGGTWVGGTDGHILVDTDGTNPVGRTSVLLVGTVEGQVDDEALTWTQYPPRPVSIRLIPVLAHTVVLPTPGRDNLDRVGTIQAGTVERNAFRQGYQDYMGNPVWEDRFIDVILNCENKTYGWVWHPSASSYITVAQFHPDSWARASAATGLDDPYNLYHVGAAVAYWSISIEHPGASGGWPGCWWEGVVP